MPIGTRTIAKKVAKTLAKAKATVERDYYCCGLSEIGGFYGAFSVKDLEEAKSRAGGKFIIATTIKEQKMDEKMEKAGFEVLKKFNGNYGTGITLWGAPIDGPE